MYPYKELTYEQALEFYNRWERTILVGPSPSECYRTNINYDKRTLDDCIRTYKNYYPDDEIKFFLNERSIDYDMDLSKNNVIC